MRNWKSCFTSKLTGACIPARGWPCTATANSRWTSGVDWPTMRPGHRWIATPCSSCTRPPSHWRRACLHILWERGQLDWDDTVARYWPGFAKHNKGGVTVRHILTHRGGFPETPPELSWERWQDWDYVVKCMEDIIPDYPAGQIMAYHPRNFGWVIGELVQRNRRAAHRGFPAGRDPGSAGYR